MIKILSQMFKKFIVVFLISLIFIPKAKASETDFSVWGLVFAKISLVPQKLNLNIVEEFRYYNDVTTFDLHHTSLGLNSNVHRNLNIGMNYHIFQLRRSSGEYYMMHGPELQVLGHHSFNGFTISLLERLGYYYAQIEGNPTASLEHFELRNLLTLKYKIGNTRFTPFVAVEPFVKLNGDDFGKWTEVRYLAGTEIKLNAHNVISIRAALVNKNAFKDIYINRFVLGIDYIVSF